MKIGIIGLGRIGKTHLKAIQKIDGLKVIAVSDIDEKQCNQIAEENKIPYSYIDYNKLIANKEVEAIWICSPSKLHYEQVSAALEHKKYVFCEKPLEIEIDKITALLNSFSDIDKRLMIGFNKRFDSEFIEAKKNIAKIGVPTIVKITSRDPAPPTLAYLKTSGGLFKDMTIHDFDMSRFIVEDDVVEVYATGSINYIEGIDGVDIDTAMVTLKFKNGIICTIDNSRQSPYGYDQRLEILGTLGMLQVNNKKVNHNSFYTTQGKQSSVYQNFFLERYADAYEQEARAFLDCVVTKREFPATAYDALKALELAEACKKSLLENRAVRIS
ncbi:inositol 2-dehydrogenase [Flavivirga aquimarina]|uniref:Inositol 2-dehydrogenase n=1 Tax=Flavivirga aquimarina TaxID=2027862 RepID=A0ABT8W6Z1_9FLAO|nr:inositol 2-dehydrogenase [Flavivirga aquimarina]MDO5968884.1 inositol 2-dehydrogenase [Flavivirga aquimarina]